MGYLAGQACGSRFSKGVALALTLMVSFTGLAQAEQVIDDLDDGVRVELQTPIDGATVQQGQTFSAKMTDDLFYEDKGWKLPAGTVFTGHVEKFKESRVFNRPAYVILSVDQAQLPDGTTFTFDPQKYDLRKKKIHNLEARTVGSTVVQQLPLTAVSSGTSIPLRTATDLNGGVIFAISMGARMVTGMVLGMTEYRGNRTLPKAAAVGAWEATGVPRAYQFLFKKDPQLALTTGTEIKLHMDPDGLADLFKAEGNVAEVK